MIGTLWHWNVFLISSDWKQNKKKVFIFLCVGKALIILLTILKRWETEQADNSDAHLVTSSSGRDTNLTHLRNTADYLTSQSPALAFHLLACFLGAHYPASYDVVFILISYRPQTRTFSVCFYQIRIFIPHRAGCIPTSTSQSKVSVCLC